VQQVGKRPCGTVKKWKNDGGKIRILRKIEDGRLVFSLTGIDLECSLWKSLIPGQQSCAARAIFIYMLIAVQVKPQTTALVAISHMFSP
jgi:hypothetical protein